MRSDDASSPRGSAGVVVTGGSSGIGLAVARLLSTAGRSVHIADLDPPPEGLDPGFAPTDVGDAASMEAFTRRALRSGPIDTLVIAAGIGVHQRLSEGDPEVWSKVLTTNVLGALRAIRAFVPGMLERNSGDVVVIGSVAARHPYAWGGVYAGSKAALEAIAETLRLETQPTVRVTCVSPGVVNTSFFSRSHDAVDTPESIGWGWIEPDEVAKAVLFALQQPRGIALNSITVRPAGQPM